ncbi:MAG: FkbM family methyltransferase [Planctomycetes bacterium]|nr:FkbM family methyltransferase [Planctomycetota bacterium]
MSEQWTIQHYQSQMAELLRTPKSFPENTFQGQGIVICAGGETCFTCAWVCINMLRHLGCTLPIELWYLGEHEMNRQMIELITPFGVTCRNAYQVAKQHPVRRLDGWELKPYALIHSTFEEVLYLDSDNVPVQNPEFLFQSPQYLETGAIFWPDRYRGNGQGEPWLKQEAWDICQIPFLDEPEIEAGQLVIHKHRCWLALQLTMHLNEHSDFYYEYFYGDKDTFHLAWRKLGLDFSLIPHPLQDVGPNLVLIQKDFFGKLLFQHRNGDKWSLQKPPLPIPGFLFERECFTFLARLKQQWNGKVRSIPDDFTSAERTAFEEITSIKTFDYNLGDSGYRTLELTPDFNVFGGSLMERFWRVQEDKNGQAVLVILYDKGVTCYLRQEECGSWMGRWLSYHRQLVELKPLLSSVTSEQKEHTVCIWNNALKFFDRHDSITTEIVSQELNNYFFKIREIDFQEGDIVVDIGAHIGMFSITLAKAFPFLKIFAFEPFPENFANLEQNIRSNRVKNVTVLNTAISKDGRKITMATNPVNTGGATAMSPYKLQRFKRVENVPSCTLEEVFQRYNIRKCKLLKIDCEGMEHEILQETKVLKDVEYLSGEFHDNQWLSDQGCSPQKLIEYCRDFFPDHKLNVSILEMFDSVN